MRFPDRIQNWTDTHESPLGCFSFAWSRDGLLQLALPGHDPALFAGLWRARTEAYARADGRDPKEVLSEAPPRETSEGVRRFLKALEAGEAPTTENIPLDLEPSGSEFERQVWDALTRIPLGETRSYGQVAAMVGNPQSARAVGRACSQNPVPLIVPCHRVMGSSGALSGFSAPGGPVVKNRLLTWERARAATAPTKSLPPESDLFQRNVTSTSGRSRTVT